MGKITGTLKVADLLERIGKEKKWSEKEVEKDIVIVKRHRLATVNDLRALSAESWAQIELLPLVKDLLRSSVALNDQDSKKSDKKQEEGDEKKQEKQDKKQDKKKKKEKEKEKEKDKEKKKEKKKVFELGEPVVPIVFNDSPSPLDLMQDPLTIQNTIKNGFAPELSTVDDTSTTDEDEPSSPSDTPVRRKSVTFSSEEPLIGTAASEGKKKKEKKKNKNNSMASTNIGYGSYPYTQPTLVNNLPPVPANDGFLQTLHDKLIANHTSSQ